MTKIELLNHLYAKYKEEFAGQEFVFGDGNTDARLLLVGEAPAKDEVRLSKPFVGAAGKNLNEFLDMLGIKREEIYITNAIKYRLSEVSSKTGRLVNRPARKDEIETSREYLIEEIRIIKPEYIVTLGNVPLKAVTGDISSIIGNLHGRITDIDILGDKYKLFPLYHPASIIYNRGLKEVYINDLRELSAIIKIR